MLRNMTANLILHERIETTDAKAKELRRVAERLITKARRIGKTAYTKQEDLSKVEKAMRLNTERVLRSYIPRFGVRTEPGGTTKKVDLVEKILLDLAKRFSDRPGGYTRAIKMGPRRGDNAPMVIVEFVGSEATVQASAAKVGADAKKATAAAPEVASKAE